MSAEKKTESPSPEDLVGSLKEENAALKKKLEDTERERDDYLRAVHAYAKASITAQDLADWAKEDEDSGHTILDVVREVKSEKP